MPAKVPIRNSRTNPARMIRLRLATDRRNGYYLVEALICCMVLAMVSAALVDGYSKIKSFSTHSQVELQAVAMAQECIDQLRAQQFILLLNNLGTHNVPVSGVSATGDVVFPRPLLRDTQALTYYNQGQTNDTQNYIQVANNQVVVDLQNGANNTIVATVTITWNDGKGKHNYITQTSLAAGGLNG